MIVAPSDQPRIVEMILNAHPEKRRLIFVHVPKCAGTDLTANLGTRYPTVHQTLADPNWMPPERLQASVDQVEQQLQEADAILGCVVYRWCGKVHQEMRVQLRACPYLRRNKGSTPRYASPMHDADFIAR